MYKTSLKNAFLDLVFLEKSIKMKKDTLNKWGLFLCLKLVDFLE